MSTEQPAERLGLGFAQLGVLAGDVSHGAVVLADLDPGRGWIDAGSESEVAQCGREGSHLIEIGGTSPVVTEDVSESSLQDRAP